MIQKLKTSIVIAAFALVLGLVGGLPQVVSADSVDHNVKCGVNFNIDGNGGTCATSKASCEKNGDPKKVCDQLGNGSSDLSDIITMVINILSVLVGVIAVVMIIVGGFKYITSGGDSNKLGSAKNTIIYAIVGLIIVALSQVIARFVVTNVT